MRRVVFSLLAASQLAFAAQPAVAAAPRMQTQLGVFGGVQVRVALGNPRNEAQVPRATLGIAPVARSEGIDGSSGTVIGEGLQLRLTPDRPAELTLAGTRLDRFRLAPGGQTPDGQRNGVSTLGWIAIGVGAVAVVVVAAAAICIDSSGCVPSE